MTKCRCSGLVDEDRYQELVGKMRADEESGDVIGAVEAALEALQVCDEDEWLHAKAVALGRSLGLC